MSHFFLHFRSVQPMLPRARPEDTATRARDPSAEAGACQRRGAGALTLKVEGEWTRGGLNTANKSLESSRSSGAVGP